MSLLLALFILIDFPIHGIVYIDTMIMDLSILYFKGIKVQNLNFNIYLSLRLFLS